MNKDTRKLATAMLTALIIVTSAAALATRAKAEIPKPSKEDYANLEDIKANQEILSECRAQYVAIKDNVDLGWKINPDFVECYNRFVEAKGWNEAEVSELGKNGWCVNWATMELTSCKQTSYKVDLSQFGEKDMLSRDQLVSILKEAGFSGENLRVAYAVVRAESSGRPRAHNNNRVSGDLSYGIFQINMIDKLGPARRKRYSLSSNDDLYQPELNARIAYEMSDGGRDWTPWGAFTNLSYRKHLASL